MADKKQKRVNHLYASFTAAIILLFIPLMSTQILGALLLLVALIWAYIMRGKDGIESLSGNHAAYIIRTIWIWGFFLSIGVIIAVPWFYSIADHSAVENFMSQAANGHLAATETVNDVMAEYMRTNLSPLIMVSAITIGPSVIYIIYRLARGLSRALKGYRVANTKNWF